MSFFKNLGGMFGGAFSPEGGMNFKAQGPDAQLLKKSAEDAQAAYDQQLAFVNAINAQGGLGMSGQSFLSDQLRAQAMGEGPNIAQNMLNEQTRANAAQQAAMMASQRGTQSNPALLARQAAMQGANIQQQAAGQGATMRANQQLAAQQQLGALAGQQIGQQQEGLGALNQAALNRQNALLGAQANQQATQGKTAQQKIAGQFGLMSAMAGSAGSAAQAGAGGMAMGGEVPQDYGYLKELHTLNMGAGGLVPGVAEVSGDHPRNDKVPTMLSPKEIVLPRTVTMSPDAPKKAAMFVAAIQARKRK
jgi:hypothetical protein